VGVTRGLLTLKVCPCHCKQGTAVTRQVNIVMRDWAAGARAAARASRRSPRASLSCGGPQRRRRHDADHRQQGARLRA
jgi:hypothetical protein